MPVFESKKPVTGRRIPDEKKKTVVSSISQISSQTQESSSKKPLSKESSPQSRNTSPRFKADTKMKNHANTPQESSKIHPQSPTKDSQVTAASHRSAGLTLTHKVPIPIPTNKRKRTTPHKATSPTASQFKDTEDETSSKENQLGTATPVEAPMLQENAH